MRDTKDSTEVSLDESRPRDEVMGIRDLRPGGYRLRVGVLERSAADDLGCRVLMSESELEV